MTPDKIYVREYPDRINKFWDRKKRDDVVATIHHEYIRKDLVIDAIKLAYGKVSMNPFDCSEAFEELLNKVGYEIH